MYPDKQSSGSSSDIHKSSNDTDDTHNHQVWDGLYPSLRTLARYLVNDFKVPSWQGQEYDVIEDIVQETMRRLIERAQKAERGEATPIQSLHQMMVVIAYNYYRDLKRRDRRLARIASATDEPHRPATPFDQQYEFAAAAFDLAVERVYQEQVFTALAHEIRDFPSGQRTALLTDLANRMTFDARPTPLQSAFLSEGIQLQQYQRPLPANPKERSRHVSLLSHAYRRVAHLPDIAED